MKKIIVFASHPDDDLIGCGGSIAKHIKQGNKVIIIYMTSGDAGSLKYSKEELAEIRKRESKKALEVFGVDDLVFLKNPDGYLECNKENLIRLINFIREVKPDIVYMPHKFDAHKDHKITHELVIEAVDRASGPWFQECKGKPWSVKTILCYEVWTPLQEISFVEDITDFIDLKIKALEQHKSQIQEIKYDEAVKGLNRYRGVMTGCGKYCECFQVLKITRI
ncbi:MAG: PIG-L family deacetylase [Patescibacteria group bacterium]